MKINLEKRAANVGIILTKKEINNIPCQVKLAIDRSGSMDNLYRNNIVQDIVERVLAVGMNFDIDKSIDVWAFTTDSFKIASATYDNIENYVRSEITSKISSGGTAYSPVIRDIINSSVPKSNFISKLFNRSTPVVSPTLGIFITDGEALDTEQTEKLIADSLDKNIYWCLLGIGTDSDFGFLEYLGDKYPNVGFFSIKDVASASDETLYSGLLTDEFAAWVKKFKV